MPSSSYGQSYGSSTSSPETMQSPQSEWGMQLSQMLATLGQSQYAWARGEYDKGMAFTADNINRYLSVAGNASELATNLLGRYKDVFEPIMDKFIEQAGSYNSEARQRFKMGEAESTVSQAMQAGGDEAERKLQSFGIDPSSGRYQDQILTSRIQRAAAMAGAGTQASVNTANTGRQMTQQAAQMGQNVPGMTVNALGAGVNALTGAQGAEQGMLNTGAALTSSAAPFFNAAGGANRLPPTGQDSQSQNRSTNRSQSAEPPQNSGGGSRGGNQGNGGQGGGRTPADYSDGQRRQADPNRSVTGPERQRTPPSVSPWDSVRSVTEQFGNQEEQGPQLPNDWQQENTNGGNFDWGNWETEQNSGGQQEQTQQQTGNYGGDGWGNYDQNQQWSQPDQSSGSGADYTNYQDTSYDSGGYYGGGYAQGGQVGGDRNVRPSMSPSGGQQTDDVSARLNVGEFVVPKDVVAHKGSEFFTNLIKKSRMNRTGQAGPAPGAKMKPALRMRPQFVSDRV